MGFGAHLSGVIAGARRAGQNEGLMTAAIGVLFQRRNHSDEDDPAVPGSLTRVEWLAFLAGARQVRGCCYGVELGPRDQTLHPLLHLSRSIAGVAAGAVGELHREAEHRSLPARRGGQSSCRARTPRHDRPGPALADHAAGQLAARRDEHRNLVAPRDLQHAVERLLR